MVTTSTIQIYAFLAHHLKKPCIYITKVERKNMLFLLLSTSYGNIAPSGGLYYDYQTNVCIILSGTTQTHSIYKAKFTGRKQLA